MIRRWYERKEEKARIKRENEEARKRLREENITKAKQLMLEKACPFQEEKKCKDTCVHFQEGYIKTEHKCHELGVDTWQVTVYPKCKLWKD